jgi:hypothetical protein
MQRFASLFAISETQNVRLSIISVPLRFSDAAVNYELSIMS